MNSSNVSNSSTTDASETRRRFGAISRLSSVPPGPRSPVSAFRIVRKPLEHLAADWKLYGDVVRYRFGKMQIFLVVHPDGVRQVLQENHRNYVKSADYQILRRVLGKGLLTSEGPLWLRQRRLIAPIFHRQRIAEFGATMLDSALEMLDQWSSLASEGRTFDICDEMMRLTLNIVPRVLFKLEIASEMANEIGRSIIVVNERLAQFDLGTLLPWVPTRHNREFRQAIRSLDAIINAIIADHRRGGPDRGDLLSLLLAARDEDTGEGMSDKQVRDEVLALMLAGHETTVNALAWTWYLLSQNPDAERKLHAELGDVLGGRTPTVADLPNLCYTSMVIDESMRLYPPAPAPARSAIADDEILGYRVPKGSSIMLSQWLTHRHPDFWENPERFDPDRFSHERSSNRPRYAYFPFGGGPRHCVGNVFALNETNLILAAIAQKYRLRMVPGHRVELRSLITLRPRYGLKMTAEPAGVNYAK